MVQPKGFPSSLRWVPVPAQLLGPYLEAIADEAELRCTLRFFWHLAQAKGHPRRISTEAFLKDDVLLGSLGSATKIRRGVELALSRGTLLCLADAAGTWLLINTPDNLRLAEGLGRLVDTVGEGTGERRALDERTVSEERPNIFSLYEANVGLLTPIVADQLKEAEERFPQEWIEAAFREAVERNKRNWRYVTSILERWAVEGRHTETEHGVGKPRYGEPRRHPEALSAAEIIRRRNLSR